MTDFLLTLIALLAAAAGILCVIASILLLLIPCKSDIRKDDDSDA